MAKPKAKAGFAGALGSASDPLKPTISVLVKLGSIVIHVEEMMSPSGHAFDRVTLDQLLNDTEVKLWLARMEELAMLPVKR